MLKNIKISTKLWGFTGILLIGILAVAGNSIWSNTGILNANEGYTKAAGHSHFMVKKEVDHLNWINKVQDLFMNNRASLQVQLDPTKCGLGKFLYGEGGKELVKIDPSLSGYLEAIKQPHKHLHESATNINEVWHKIHPGLSEVLAARLDDHRRWTQSLMTSILANEEIKVQTDPAKCKFGKWLASEEAKKLVSEWPEFATIIDKVKNHHHKLHESAIRIKQASTQEDKARLLEEVTSKELEQVARLFGNTQQLEAQLAKAQAEAKRIFETTTILALKATQEKMKALSDKLQNNQDSSKAEMISTGARSRWSAGVVTGFVFILGAAISFFLIRAITKPIVQGVDFAEKMSDGDLTQALDIDQKDEMGILAKALNSMGSNLRQMFKNIASGVETLSSSSTELSAISQQMFSGAEQSSGKSNTVATAAEEMSSNMTTVAAAAEQASTNADVIASSAEEMTATINEIAQNSEKARTITGDAVSQTTSVSERVGGLGKAAQEISKVTETITEISEQTNLLALNATIEAARAGEAGKGFAVVANEIKELARQTAEATGEIKSRIDGIQDSTASAIADIEQIPQVINDVNELVSTIATAVEEQSVTTKEIAGNVAQASQGMKEVTENVAQGSTVAGDIARDISEVNQAAGEMSNSSSQVNISAQELSKLGEQLKEMVGKFKV